ncbi:substrate-binding domain-containing protein [Aureibaculum sp. 2210JD6-5]|uniref:substrate-binding domain-containing protein n=1 Tax=Aureibaculum sp. 2210JD6-5 TaxID=3103957 RepID=UPI002AAD6953|nr:substrate-binding domain-containing protein [Aureibaculum sp. 2210JD6-5]MDY7396581.1 substrate-binding domain-containing protein [Aureibaculum sp. 2210JD6-5]
MNKITIGGVPEHFNLPWHFAIENNKFKDKNVDLQWKEFPGGTGAMCSALRDGSIDAAVILTEGIIKDIIAGNPSKIVKVYVDSALLWGIHVAKSSEFNSVSELENAKIAISRYGSGSQLMAKVNAVEQGFDIEQLEYVLVKNLQGGVNALTNGTADYFMWEHFMTKPYVDNGTFRRIDNIETPWPCFVIAVRNEVLKNQNEAIRTIIEVINNQLKYFENPLENEQLIQMFSKRYQLKLEDVKTWLSLTKWNNEKNISEKLINSIQNKLTDYDVIRETVPAKVLTQKLF